ncbi:sugar ABC transporter ATP-binding protein [Clostridiales bacterium COT073_COT-073]|nr:sugar ABC transporter ATP-binding protein [Clostridiales bacterium COT073_COT-073]
MAEILLEMKNIHKKFPGVYALKGANLTLHQGEVHTLVGENGAGKSTLINVLGGIHQKEEGEIFIEGKKCQINNVLDARKNGISIIHQELVLVPYLSVAENIFLNREPGKGGMVDYRSLFANAQKFVNDLGLSLDVKKKVMELTIAQQQLVEIVKAISFQSKIIVMDEPTSSLSDKEIEALFEYVKMLKQRGIGIIYISHRLSELEQISDYVTVLRDGETIKSMKVSETSHEEIVKLMVGREMKHFYIRSYRQPGKAVLEVKNITSHKVRGISFQIRQGEIVGFAGLVGAGRTEIVKAILGFDKLISGEIKIDGQPVMIHEPAQAYELGVGYIPEDRRSEGIIPLQTVKFNISLKALHDFIRGVRVDQAREKELTQQYMDKLSIKAASQNTLLQNLSGGNQQKAVIARWLATNPKLLIMDEPTRGIDVGAKAEIYQLMDQLAAQGIAILMISSELPEIINMSDRVIVMREGQISGILNHEDATQERIMSYAVSI